MTIVGTTKIIMVNDSIKCLEFVTAGSAYPNRTARIADMSQTDAIPP